MTTNSNAPKNLRDFNLPELLILTHAGSYDTGLAALNLIALKYKEDGLKCYWELVRNPGYAESQESLYSWIDSSLHINLKKMKYAAKRSKEEMARLAGPDVEFWACPVRFEATLSQCPDSTQVIESFFPPQ